MKSCWANFYLEIVITNFLNELLKYIDQLGLHVEPIVSLICSFVKKRPE